jgi:hypothetical protein
MGQGKGGCGQMKFSDIKGEEWDELKPYLDTCLLPVTGLTGTEQPWEATLELAKLKDALDALEIPYKGRVVTYPAMHYLFPGREASDVDQACQQLRDAGFRYVVVVTANGDVAELSVPSADLLLSLNFLDDSLELRQQQRQFGVRMEQVWSGIAAVE